MPTLLMIDDDEALVDLMRDYLTSQGFELHSAHDGEEGLAVFERVAPDLVILDVMLPGQDGFEICKLIRRTSRVPILMLTARGEETDRIVGLEIGADDYLAKPFNPRELVARIKAVLRRIAEPPPSQRVRRQQIGPLSLDEGSRTVTLRGQPIDLTTAEFDLLAVLAASAGRVLSRDQLMEKLHGSSWSYFDRSIDVHISRIRRKIEHDPRRPVLLKTIRGVGYQLARVEEDAR